MYVLDTNSVSYFLKGKGRVADRLLAEPVSSVALPAVVLYELEDYARSTKRARCSGAGSGQAA